MAEVLLVSKPLAPPWTDGAKNLVRDLCEHTTRHRFRCLVPKGVDAPGGHIAEPIYGSSGDYAPALVDNLKVLARLARPRRDDADIFHFFFAPNPRTSVAAAAMMRFRRKPTVHTVVSRPNGKAPLFADIHVALSEHTAWTLKNLGAKDVRVIRPGIPETPPTLDGSRKTLRERLELPDRPLVLFPGDLIEGGGAPLFAEVARSSEAFHPVFACRPKGEGHERLEARLRAEVRDATWLGEVSDMPALLAAVDAVCLPATNLLGKMDIPMVLLEALRLGRPVVVSNHPPLSELDQPGVMRVEPRVEALRPALEALMAADHAPPTLAPQYSVTAMAAAYEALYDELAN